MREVKCLIQTHISARGIFTIIITILLTHNITEILVEEFKYFKKTNYLVCKPF